jgi:hypothetical protein
MSCEGQPDDEASWCLRYDIFSAYSQPPKFPNGGATDPGRHTPRYSRYERLAWLHHTLMTIELKKRAAVNMTERSDTEPFASFNVRTMLACPPTRNVLLRRSEPTLRVKSGRGEKLGRCPLYPQQRTSLGTGVTSAKCQKQTCK